MMRPTLAAHEFLREMFPPGGRGIDATMGNGHDTCFLAELAGKDGKVWGFDIQPEALEATKKKLEEAGLDGTVELHLLSHAEMETVVKEPVDAVMFNLGYLPGGDEGIVTVPEETLKALEVSTRLLKPGGGMSVVCYPGHEGGDREAEAVVEWAWSLDPEFWEVSVQRPEGREHVPFLIRFRRRA